MIRTGMNRNKWRFSNALIRKYIEVFTTFPASKNKSSFHEHTKTLPSENHLEYLHMRKAGERLLNQSHAGFGLFWFFANRKESQLKLTV